MILTQRRRETKKEDEQCAHPLSQFPSLMEGLGVAPRALARNAAGNPQAGGDGGQDGCYCLNDEFPRFFLHDVH